MHNIVVVLRDLCISPVLLLSAGSGQEVNADG